MTSFCERLRAATRWSAIVVALGVPALAAHGQTPAVTPAPVAVTVPKPECGAKPEHPGRMATEVASRQWRRDANAYLECYKKFAMDQRALAQQQQDAANAVIDEYNAAVKEMQAAADAAQAK